MLPIFKSRWITRLLCMYSIAEIICLMKYFTSFIVSFFLAFTISLTVLFTHNSRTMYTFNWSSKTLSNYTIWGWWRAFWIFIYERSYNLFSYLLFVWPCFFEVNSFRSLLLRIFFLFLRECPHNIWQSHLAIKPELPFPKNFPFLNFRTALSPFALIYFCSIISSPSQTLSI